MLKKIKKGQTLEIGPDPGLIKSVAQQCYWDALHFSIYPHPSLVGAFPLKAVVSKPLPVSELSAGLLHHSGSALVALG